MKKVTKSSQSTSSAAPASDQATNDNASGSVAVAAANAPPTLSASSGALAPAPQPPPDAIRKREANEAASFFRNYVENHKNHDTLSKSKKYNTLFKSIKEKVNKCQYLDVWEPLRDLYAMFDEAPPKTQSKRKAPSKTSGTSSAKEVDTTEALCSELAEDFRTRADDYMKRRNYCCGSYYYYCLNDLTCQTAGNCVIGVNEVCYEDGDTLVCAKCFKEAKGEIETIDDMGQTIKIQKKNLKKTKNDKKESEPFITCTECERKLHIICARHVPDVDAGQSTTKFVCDTCLTANGKQRQENRFRAKELLQSELSKCLEKRVNEYLANVKAGVNVIIRVINCASFERKVDFDICSFFKDMPKEFYNRTKAIFAFVEDNGRDMCFFGFYVEEFKANCEPPNSNRVYLSYFDSVLCHALGQHRRGVHYQILIGYLDYIRYRGYKSCHIWSCPPKENQDYIFNCHPPANDQKKPTREALTKWYEGLFNEAIDAKVISRYTNYYEYFVEKKYKSPKEIPYFDGDPWYCSLTKAVTTAKATNIKVNSQSLKKIFIDAINDMKEQGEDTWILELNDSTVSGTVVDIDDFVTCQFVEYREVFLLECRKNHWEFCTHRRALYSSMAFLHKALTETNINVVVKCNDCKNVIKTEYNHCSICPDFDQCEPCFSKNGHIHKMEKSCHFSGRTTGHDQTASTSPVALPSSVPTSAQSPDDLDVMEHVLLCRESSCTLNNCNNVKQLSEHAKSCKADKSQQCAKCKNYFEVGAFHSRRCTNTNCAVPLCDVMKSHLEHRQQLRNNEKVQTLQSRSNSRRQSNSVTSDNDNDEKMESDDSHSADNSDPKSERTTSAPVSPRPSSATADSAARGKQKECNAAAHDSTLLKMAMAVELMAYFKSQQYKEDIRKKTSLKETGDIINLLRYIAHKLPVAQDADATYRSRLEKIKSDYRDNSSLDAWSVLSDIRCLCDSALSEHRHDQNSNSTEKEKWIELDKEVQSNANKFMKDLGYCCGNTYYNSLYALPCCLKRKCHVQVNAEYYSYENSIICKTCFENASELEVQRGSRVVTLSTEPLKKKFSKRCNDKKEAEPFIICTECRRRFHQICAMHIDGIDPQGFMCTDCLTINKRQRNMFRAQGLPQCRLASHLENQINDRFKDCGAGHITIRVLRSPKNYIEVDKKICQEFPNVPQNFPAFLKSIFAFRDVGGHDACFFGMFVQEHETDFLDQNKHVYISHMERLPSSADAATHFPLRDVCETIILSYLEYARTTGYKWCHIRLKSVDESDQCKFFCNQSDSDLHHGIQNLLKTEMTKIDSPIQNVVSGDDYFSKTNYEALSSIPYFDSDLWPDMDSITRKVQQNISTGSTGYRKAITDEVFLDLNERQKGTLVVTLRPASATNDGDTHDPVSSSLWHVMGSPDEFLSECQQNRWEFSSLRRNLFSSLAFLYSVHSSEPCSSAVICNKCKMYARWYYSCTVCSSYLLCKQCYDRELHVHKMDQKLWDNNIQGSTGGGSIDSSSSQQSVAALQDVPLSTKLDMLQHVCRCNNAMCRVKECQKMKSFAMTMITRETAQDAELYERTLQHCFTHAGCCTQAHCSQPLCIALRRNTEQALPMAIDGLIAQANQRLHQQLLPSPQQQQSGRLASQQRLKEKTMSIVQLMTRSARSVPGSSHSYSVQPQETQPLGQLLPQERLVLTFPPQQLLDSLPGHENGTVRVLVQLARNVQTASSHLTMNQAPPPRSPTTIEMQTPQTMSAGSAQDNIQSTTVTMNPQQQQQPPHQDLLLQQCLSTPPGGALDPVNALDNLGHDVQTAAGQFSINPATPQTSPNVAAVRTSQSISAGSSHSVTAIPNGQTMPHYQPPQPSSQPPSQPPSQPSSQPLSPSLSPSSSQLSP